MWRRNVVPIHSSRTSLPWLMREELSQALAAALYELDVLPDDEAGALVGLYAVMDDLEQGIRRTKLLDPEQES